MSKIKNGGLDQYGTGPFEQQQFGTAGVEGVKQHTNDKIRIYTVLLGFWVSKRSWCKRSAAGGRGDTMAGTPCRDVSMTSYRGLGDAALLHGIAYVLSPATMVTHLVMMFLLYRLVVDGALGRHQLTLLLLGEELLVYVLWLAVDHGLRAPFAIWVCLTVYETLIAKPRIRYQDRAVLLTGKIVANFLSLFSYIQLTL